ncbi:PPE family protein [Mycobacterium simiae]|uniref:PPE family protein n=1 Tax=Mycobacterium simiae TaxID=1784 RepID=A0A1X0XRP2_MYCSI|nr:PPE family protein [Mycobacterium simiae]ORJ55575.1 hypothetical protein B5M45_24775 [Mycobacterium simiae]
MAVIVDFSTLPPEINSARMHSGPGSAPMLAAASAWHGLAAELRTTTLSYRSVVLALTDDDWRGPASAAMATAATTFVSWLSRAAQQAELTATQAAAAARAYETALAATVPPDAVADNRAQLAILVTTNALGQNSPAIAVAEAHYAEMWAQDAIAMYGYASASAAATRLVPFMAPPATSRAATEAGDQEGNGVGKPTHAQLLSAIPRTLQALASPRSFGRSNHSPDHLFSGASVPPWMQTLWSNWGPNATLWDTIFSSAFFMPGNWLGNVTDFMGLNGAQAASVAAETTGSTTTSAAAVPLPAAHMVGASATAGVGKASVIGPLSVPPSWTAVPQSGVSIASTSAGTPMVAPAASTAVPGMPAAPPSARPYGRPTPQYGFRPTFVARPPSAG